MIRTRRSNNTNRTITGINITPFTDVCLVLLIIFLLTASDLIHRDQMPEKGIIVPLPQADNTTILPAAPIIIDIDDTGNIFLNEKLSSLDKLHDDLIYFAENYPTDNAKQLIVINADKQIEYEKVIQVINIAGKAGVGTVALATVDPPDKSAE